MVGSSVRAEAVLDQVLAEARRLLRATRAEIVLVDRDNGRPGQVIRNIDESVSPESVPALPPGKEQAVWRDVVGSGQSRVLPRTSKEPRVVEYLTVLGARDCIVAPLRSEGEVVGTITVADRLGDVSTFDEQDLKLFETLANHASVAFENGRLVQQLRREAEERRYEALHDALTGLPNRSLFIQAADTASRSGMLGAVMLMDLDRFKEVNDTLGHHNGDQLLREVARRLSAVLRRGDTVARLGGDEFAVLLPNLGEIDEAVQTAHRLVEAVRIPITVDDLSLDVGVSVGIAVAPTHGDDAATLLQRADVAMYEAKAAKTGVSLYSPERDDYSPKRLALAAELRQALENDQIMVYYQPKADLRDGRVIGAEALVRWRHATHGMVSPDEFVPLAEHSGLIAILTQHVLRTALAQCREWVDLGHDITVAVNLSVRSLVDLELPHRIEQLLAESGVAPERLTLEITESGVMADPSRTIAVLERLANTGVKISVDDFGTGYSSLSYLQRLPVHEVKVDRSFVFRMASDANDAAIVRSIVDLGHTLGLTTVAEGVEDQVSWDRLRVMGCDVAQGYHLSKAIPGAEVTRWLEERRLLADSSEPAGALPAAARPGGAASQGAMPDLDDFVPPRVAIS
ncbi:MAG TPA: bifunctional diguanylate cyclase/phosphodiesterase, partial [Acidimicrobiales bacterium]|nr:bifunctional diguanylate cyclase/phosphodiesterase [Acidimicrobiales bacterium]